MTTVVVEEIEPGGWHAREVFANFGLAMYTAQVLEHGIINLSHWTSIHDGTIRTLTDFEEDDAKLFRQTMGTLRRTLMDRRSDINHLEDLLVRASACGTSWRMSTSGSAQRPS